MAIERALLDQRQIDTRQLPNGHLIAVIDNDIDMIDDSIHTAYSSGSLANVLVIINQGLGASRDRKRRIPQQNQDAEARADFNDFHSLERLLTRRKDRALLKALELRQQGFEGILVGYLPIPKDEELQYGKRLLFSLRTDIGAYYKTEKSSGQLAYLIGNQELQRLIGTPDPIPETPIKGVK